MKEFEEILANKRFHWAEVSKYGLRGVIYMPAGSWQGTVIVSNSYGWEHVSVCPFRKSITPSWDDMSFIKDQFWHNDEAVIEVHPPKLEYVNNLPNCLHLWRCTYMEMVLPPSCLVGIKPGQSSYDLQKEIEKLEKITKG